MCRGPLLRKIVLYSLPLMISYILQLLFNAADLMIIGQFSHRNSMAAIGSTMNLNALFINMFIGLAVGCNVITSRTYGENDAGKMSRTVHSSMLLSLLSGIILMFLGLIAAKPLLIIMQTPAEILDKACLYIRLCVAATPFIMVYNFGSAILRSVGDTRRPLWYLVISGITNVVLNVLFVVVFHMDVAGVALATAISHLTAAVLVVRTLLKTDAIYGLKLSRLRIHGDIFREILIVGVPASIQGSCFSISNMIIQSSINSFGAAAIAGSTAALSLEGIVYMGGNTYHQTAISFTAQNLGGKKFKRIVSVYFWCSLCAVICCTVFGWGFYLCGEELLSFYNTDPEVIFWGLARMKSLFLIYALCGLMESSSGVLRGMGYSFLSSAACIFGSCIVRVWWVLAVFPVYRTWNSLMVSYPISWAIIFLISLVAFIVVYRRLLCKKCNIATPWLGMVPGAQRGYRSLVGSK